MLSIPDPITKLFPLLLGGYVWQLHGVGWAILIAALYVVANIAMNLFYLMRIREDEDVDLIRGLQRIKWGLFIVGMVLTGLSGASACHIDPKGQHVCERL